KQKAARLEGWRRGEPGDHVPRGEYPIGVVHILYDHTAEGDGISRRPAPPSMMWRGRSEVAVELPNTGADFARPYIDSRFPRRQSALVCPSGEGSQSGIGRNLPPPATFHLQAALVP